MRAVRAAVIGLVLCTAPAAAQLENVGSLSFPTSGSAEAQNTSCAAPPSCTASAGSRRSEQFQAAQKLQPDFAMAYWGETLCYNHPLNPRAGHEEPAGDPGTARARPGNAAGQGANAA